MHLYQGNFPLPIGYVIGHEPMGIVEEVGPEVTKVKKLKLQGGTLGPIQISTKTVRKCGTVQITGVYGGLYNMFPQQISVCEYNERR